MPARLFDDILTQGIRQGKVPARTAQSRAWFRDVAGGRSRVSERALMRSDTSRNKRDMRVGDMYMFHYDAKHKLTLPYWDRFPLVFPFKKLPGGFLGMNFHYLPLNHRAKLMDALYELSTNDRYDETTRLKLNYELLNGASRYRDFKPTIHHYLNEHMGSMFWYVYPAEWDIALFLPLERFEKANKQKVWDDSVRKIRGK